MCGISGYVGKFDAHTRLALVAGMASGIDTRGSHGAGYVSVDSEGRVAYGRRLGYWAAAKPKFYYAASSGEATVQHARFATCGRKTANEVHPFAIQRGGKTVLWGCHNGILYSADESAKRHGRKAPAVDSIEALELVADRKYEAVGDISGYGTLAWIENANRQTVRLVRMTGSADLEIAQLKAPDGTVGYAFGSTRTIVSDGAKVADCEVVTWYEVTHGTVIDLSSEHGPVISGDTIKLKAHTSSSYGWALGGDDDWWDFSDRQLSERYGRKTSFTPNVHAKAGENDADEVDTGWQDEWRKYIKDIERDDAAEESAAAAAANALLDSGDDVSLIDDESGELRLAWEANADAEAKAADDYARREEARKKYLRALVDAKDAALCGNWAKQKAKTEEADKHWAEAYGGNKQRERYATTYRRRVG